MSLGQRATKGIFWAYATFFGGRILTLITTAILAQLLTPHDFGLIGFSLVIMAFIEISRGLGINDALIYTSEEIEETASTVFWLNVVIGFLQTIALFLLAPLTLRFFDDPRLVDVVRLMSFTFIFYGLGQTHDALLQKDLEFKRRFVPDLLSNVIKGVVSIILAMMGYGVWSLVWGHLVGAAARTIAKWYVLRWMPLFVFSFQRARELWNYGVYILLLEIMGVALDQADQAIIGSLLGAVELGYYTIAARIPEMVIANFSVVLTRVIFPTFAKMKDDLHYLTQGFLRTTQYTAFVTVPAGFGMAAVARELVLVFFGEQWIPSIILLQVLSLLGMAITMPWSVGDVFKALGRPDIPTKILVIETLFTFPIIIVMVYHHPAAVTASLANLIAMCLAVVLRFGVISYFLKLNPLVFFRIFGSPFIAASLMVLVIALWRHEMAGSLSLVVLLVSSILLGGVVYGITLFGLERKTLLETQKLFMDMVKQDDSADSE